MSALMTSVQLNFSHLQITHCEVADALRAALRLTDRIKVPLYFSMYGTRRNGNTIHAGHELVVHMEGCEERLPINPAADKVLAAFHAGHTHCYPFKD